MFTWNILFKLKNTLVLVLVACLMVGCKTETLSSRSDNLPKDFTLQAGESILVNDINFQFERVASDSRCPKGTQCMSEGSAEVIINYTIDETPIQKTLRAKSPVTYSDSLTVSGIRFTLVYLKPYPATNIRINPAEYQAHFIADREGDLDNATVIDVRTPEEFEAGHYSYANNLPLGSIASSIDSLNLGKDELIVVYCRSGNRAAKAKAKLLELGYSNVINATNQDVVRTLLK